MSVTKKNPAMVPSTAADKHCHPQKLSFNLIRNCFFIVLQVLIALVFLALAVRLAWAFCLTIFQWDGAPAPMLKHEATWGDFSDAIAAIATCLTLVVVLWHNLGQQKALNAQTRIQGATALVQAETSKISEAKAIIETLWKGAGLPLEKQAMAEDDAVFEDLKTQLGAMIPDEANLKQAKAQVDAWRRASRKRNNAIQELEDLSKLLSKG